MFFLGSRYERTGVYTVTTASGQTVSVARLPLASTAPMRGFHPRKQGQRLDLIAAKYLNDPTAFWRLCDANQSMVPDALAVHELIGVPVVSR